MTIRPPASALPVPPSAAHTPTARPAAPASATPSAPLTAAERQAVAQQFPEQPALALRVYGPARPPAAPAGLGARLDLRG